ncbi:hypothetical protein C0995_004889 [Termitomyces sp. Mi166|nr:hypothetical protein C0995_004889 [Termitomyces sp. Mi166\
MSKMDVVNFPSNVPARAGLGQLLFLCAVAILAPPPQLAVVVVTTDPRTPEQYDGLIVTQQKAAAASKSKGKVVPTLSDKSNYGESLSMHEWELEEGESVAQRFQRVQYNKKLAAKKANKAKAEAALQHRAINDFSGCISDRLGVKVWGPLDVEQLNLCFKGALSNCVYYSVHNNAIFIGADANQAAAFEYSAHQRAKMPASLVYKFAPRGFPHTPYELEQLYKHYANEHALHRDRVVVYLLMNELLLFAQKLDESLLDRTMRALLHNPIYRDLQSPIQGGWDNSAAMHTPDPSQPFDLEQIAQYVLIFGWLELENTWQGIAFDFAYRMHWRTLFGFALCWALCATSAAKPAVVRQLVLVMAQPRMYWEVVASYNAAFLDQPMVAQYRSHLNLMQIPLDWVDHAYTYSVVYLEQQFHSPTMSMDIFHKINDERLQCLLHYGTPPAIPQWDEWREISEDDHYRLLFKRNEERALPDSPEAKGLYYYIGMNPNQVHLWKRMAAHSPLPPVPTATNIASVESSVVAATTALGPSAPPEPVPASQEPATNIATGDVTMALELGEVPEKTAGSGP